MRRFIQLILIPLVTTVLLTCAYSPKAEAATASSWTAESIAFYENEYAVTDMLEYDDMLFASVNYLMGPIHYLENEISSDSVLLKRRYAEPKPEDQMHISRTDGSADLLVDSDVPLWAKIGSSWNDVDTSPLTNFGLTNAEISDMIEYDEMITVGTYNSDNGAEVWTYDGNEWDDIGWSTSYPSGEWDINNTDATSLEVIGSTLYVGFTNTATGSEVWSYNGIEWAQINDDGFSDPCNRYVDSLAVLDSVLYAGVFCTDGSDVRIYRYNGGTSWSQVNSDGFGDTTTNGVYALTSYDGNLYAGVEDAAGAAIWRYDNPGWTLANTKGFGTGNDYLSDFAIYNGSLYASSGGVAGEVWRYNGTTWSLAGTSGIDIAGCWNATTLEVYRGKLFTGTHTGIFMGEPGVSSWYSVDTSSVYRFWNNTSRHHFYTISSAEKDSVIANYPEWSFEGAVYATAPASADGLSPVYRFWSARYHGHFYTISEAEKDYVIANLSHDWAYEGVAYYAGPSIGAASVPVYRFWSNNYRSHFYTTSAEERDYVIANLSHDWAYEGIAFYVF